MGRILAIDYGSKRSGIATTDPLGIIATPLEALLTHHIFDFLGLRGSWVNEWVLCYGMDGAMF